MVARRPLVLVDADTLAGWRRPSASLDQLRAALADLAAQAPEVPVAVIVDPSLKWALPVVDQERIEDDVRSRALLFSPAGVRGGHLGFLAHVVDRAEELGFRPVVITDQVVAGVRVGRVRREGTTFVFDLEGAEPSVAAPAGGGPRRRRRGTAA